MQDLRLAISRYDIPLFEEISKGFFVKLSVWGFTLNIYSEEIHDYTAPNSIYELSSIAFISQIIAEVPTRNIQKLSTVTEINSIIKLMTFGITNIEN